MCFMRIQVEKKHILGFIDSDGFELHRTRIVAGNSYPFHGTETSWYPLISGV